MLRWPTSDGYIWPTWVVSSLPHSWPELQKTAPAGVKPSDARKGGGFQGRRIAQAQYTLSDLRRIPRQKLNSVLDHSTVVRPSGKYLLTKWACLEYNQFAKFYVEMRLAL